MNAKKQVVWYNLLQPAGEVRILDYFVKYAHRCKIHNNLQIHRSSNAASKLICQAHLANDTLLARGVEVSSIDCDACNRRSVS